MGLLRLAVHPDSPHQRHIDRAASILKDGGIAAYPTDTVYGMGAAVSNAKGIDRIATIIHKDKSRLFSFICTDFSMLSQYAQVSNSNFKLIKHLLPGPYTFILPASNLVPKKISPKRTTVGVRIPDCPATLALVKALGEPLANTSLDLSDDQKGCADDIAHAHMHDIDVMIDIGDIYEPVISTIVDLTGDQPVLIRAGKGVWLES